MAGQDSLDETCNAALWEMLLVAGMIVREVKASHCSASQANRGGEASTSCAASATEALNGSQAAASSGAADTAEDSALTPHAEEPAWLQLPAVHYALMQGNQQPCFRLATGQHDTRHWLAWEVGRHLH